MATLDLLVEAFDRVRGMDLRPVLDGEVHVGKDVNFAVVDEGGKLRPLASELVGGVTQRLAGTGAIGLDKGLAERGRDHALLGLADMGQGVAHPVNAASLPGRANDPADGGLEALVGVGDDQLHPAQVAAHQALEEGGPEGLGLGGTDMQPDDLALALGGGGHGDYRGDRDGEGEPCTKGA